ncbi:MAG: HAD family hydrolase [Pseudomonadota bacterium]
MQTIRIAMWSGPRNISTAMMRAWEARGDCAVVDEPFYAAYLATTGLNHPMHDEILAGQSQDWAEVASDCAQRAGAPVIYQKHMTQHMVPEAPLDWMAHVRHAFLIRPPEEVAASFSAKMDHVTAEDLGFRRQAELFDLAFERMGVRPPVVEARDVLENPEGMLRALCAALEVPFAAAMLSWAPGRRESDGIWAAHWYGAVEQSTGFAAPRSPAKAPAHLSDMIAECEPFYQQLASHRLTAA